MKRAITLFSLFFLCGCAKGAGMSLLPYAESAYTPQNFRVCHGFSCSYKTPVSFTEEQWSTVTAVFEDPAKNAAQERWRIAEAIALVEREVASATGMRPDRARAETFESDQHQMDCIDETINTSLYLRFFDKAGFLKFHHTVDPVHRGYFIDGLWPHNSAAVRERASGDVYAIDSYYSDNGEAVYAVPLDTWLDEWRPNPPQD